jgi:hypothetical protein
MKRSVIAAFSAMLVAVVLSNFALPARAADTKSAIVAVARTIVDSFNTGDVSAFAAPCTSPASVTDDFAPYHWQGPTACADWVRDFKALSASMAMTGAHVTMGNIVYFDSSGNHAEGVFPVTFSYKSHGKATSDHAYFCVAYVKAGDRWRVASWTWADISQS